MGKGQGKVVPIRIVPTMVTTQVVRLKLFRLKGPEERNCGALAKKQQIFASNIASKCAI
jgi:hypothetical protein